MENSKLDHIINIIREDMAGGGVPVNNVSGGKIAGTPAADPGNPPVNRKKRNYLYLKNARKLWKKPLPTG
jgi:hypothetical protein